MIHGTQKNKLQRSTNPTKTGGELQCSGCASVFFFFHRFLFLITFHVFGTITGCLDVPRENNIPTYNFNIKELKEYKYIRIIVELCCFIL